MSFQLLAPVAVALCLFASNSLLCRLALADRQIDAASFTAVRLASGALLLGLLAARRAKAAGPARGSWASAAMLFAYAAPFSYAYLRLGAAMGALILFAAVQVTMIGWGVVRGERPSALAWLGIALALGGLVGLTLPGRTAPDPIGATAMAVAGVAWGLYSLRGRFVSGDPVANTSAAFTRSLPLVALWLAIELLTSEPHASLQGLALALTSGALASGLGYAIWYSALPKLSATRAAVLQLLVPILAALGAIAWLGESLTSRLVVASIAILGGVALSIGVRSIVAAPAR